MPKQPDRDPAPGAAAASVPPHRWEGLGVPVDVVDAVQAEQWIEQAIAAGTGGWVCTPNPEMAVAAWGDPDLRAAMRGAGLSVADGVGMLVGSHILGGPLAERVPGIELLERSLARCARRGWPVFFLGARPGVAAAAAERSAARIPGLRVAGVHHGYFTPAESARVVAAIASSGARLVAVGMGHPKQELWLAANAPSLPAVVGFACGGSLDVLAGRVRRAPGWTRRLGLEWLYRIVAQPRERLRRSKALPVFLARVVAIRLGLARRFG